MASPLQGKSFRAFLAEAIRTDEDHDWTPHTIDYAVFKQILKGLAIRRSKLRQMLRDSPDGKIADNLLQQELLAQYSFPLRRSTDVSNVLETSVNTAEETSGYISFDLDGSDASDLDSQKSGNSTTIRRRSRRTVLRKVSSMERAEMMAFLTWEMDKVQMFYLSQWQRLSSSLELLKNSTSPLHHDGAMGANTPTMLSTSALEQIGDEILELFAFCVINIVAARQILIRYDAYARTFEGTPMLAYYMKKVTKYPTSFRKILQHEELVALSDSFSSLFPDSQNFQAQREMFKSILISTCSEQAMSVSGQTDIKDSFIKTARAWFLVGSYEDPLGLEPAYLILRGKSLTEEMIQLVSWRQSKDAAHIPKPEKKKLTSMQVYNLTLNLLSALLYCMNYYIVEPSSTMYVNRLGAHDALSGTLIGMMPLAAFASSIPYSMWTNYSFRHPFLMSCCMMIIGNLIYSLADQVKVVEVALLGRFLAGLGAPKCIIRRYMADTTPLSLRTGVNAGFGMVVAAGSAMGPAMAVLLNRLEYTTYVPLLGLITFNGLTMPGYFMAAMWLTFAVIVFATFDEPDREGLEEQKRLEMEGRGGHGNGFQKFPYKERTRHDDDLRTIFSGQSADHLTTEHLENQQSLRETFSDDLNSRASEADPYAGQQHGLRADLFAFTRRVQNYLNLITTPVRLCLGLLFAKVFTIEALVSATSALSKNRYHWQVEQVGTLGFVNGCLVIPFSIMIGRLSLSYQDQQLMRYLVAAGSFGMFLLIDLSDLVATPTGDYNRYHALAVGPKRYISGYFLSYLSIQAFEGVIGSTLSKVIPTALASGTMNSGLLATLVDTLGRACGDLFISLVGFINLRQLLNLLFIPGFTIMISCLVAIERHRDMLAV